MNNIKLVSSLLVFSEVAHNRSFTKAAVRLSMSKSAVSQHVARLESSLGVSLMTRTTRGISLTQAGRVLFSRGELLNDQVALALKEAAISAKVPSGRFAVTAPHSLEQNVVVPALAQMCKEFPKLQPELIVSDKAKDLIKDRLDIAIFAGSPKDSDYHALPLESASEILCASPTYLTEMKSINSIDNLNNCRWVKAPWQTETFTIYHNSNSLPHQITPRDTANCNTLNSTIAMIVQNMGVGLLPEFALREPMESNKLIRVARKFHGKSWPFHFLHRFGKQKPIHVARFYSLIKHYFKKTLYP